MLLLSYEFWALYSVIILSNNVNMYCIICELESNVFRNSRKLLFFWVLFCNISILSFIYDCFCVTWALRDLSYRCELLDLKKKKSFKEKIQLWLQPEGKKKARWIQGKTMEQNLVQGCCYIKISIMRCPQPHQPGSDNQLQVPTPARSRIAPASS